MRFSEFKSTLESIDHDLIATAMLAKEKAAKQDKSSIPMQAFLNMLKNLTIIKLKKNNINIY